MLMMSQGEHWVNAITKQLQGIARSKHRGNSLKSQNWKKVKGNRVTDRAVRLWCWSFYGWCFKEGHTFVSLPQWSFLALYLTSLCTVHKSTSSFGGPDTMHWIFAVPLCFMLRVSQQFYLQHFRDVSKHWWGMNVCTTLQLTAELF